MTINNEDRKKARDEGPASLTDLGPFLQSLHAKVIALDREINAYVKECGQEYRVSCHLLVSQPAF